MRKLILVIFLFALSGCGLEKEIVDDIHIITAVAYDYIEDDLFEGTAIVPIYTQNKGVDQETYTSESFLSKSMLDLSNLKSSETLVNGKLVVVIYGSELARQGIQEMFDTLIRDPSVGANVHLAIAKDKAKPMLKMKKSKVEDIGINLSKLIEQNAKSGAIPTTNLHQFVDAYYEEGIDPILPVLDKVSDNDIKIIGLGLFKGDKLVDTIKPNRFFTFRVLQQPFKNGSYNVKLSNGEYASIQNITAKKKVKIKNLEGNSPTFEYKVKISGIIKEYSGNKLTPKAINLIKKDMEKEIKGEADELLQKFKEHNIDPIGLGRHVKRHDRDWNESKWYDQLNNSKVNLDIDITIVQSGVVE